MPKPLLTFYASATMIKLAPYPVTKTKKAFETQAQFLHNYKLQDISGQHTIGSAAAEE